MLCQIQSNGGSGPRFPFPVQHNTPLSCSCLSPARSRLLSPLHCATPASWRWIFQPSECSPVDTEKALKERDSSEPKKQNKFHPFVEESAVISNQGLEKHSSPEKSRPGQAPGRCMSELHAWAKVTEALANIPRSFLPCAGLAPAASSQAWEDC